MKHLRKQKIIKNQNKIKQVLEKQKLLEEHYETITRYKHVYKTLK